MFGYAYCLLLYSASPSLSLLIPAFLFPFLQSLFAGKKMEQRRVSCLSFAVPPVLSVLSSLFLFFCSLFAIFLLFFFFFAPLLGH
jgi:F0F1-type ATP synthase assembly protein I